MRQAQRSSSRKIAGWWRPALLAALLLAVTTSGVQAQAARFQHLFGDGGSTLPTLIHPGGIEQTKDGGAIVAGVPDSLKGFFVVKLHADGSPQWGESLTFPNAISGIRLGIRQTSDGGYILAGKTRNIPIVLIRLKPSGDVMWAKAYDAPSALAAFDSPQVREMAGGGFAVAGTETGATATSLRGVLLLTSSDGTVIGGGRYSAVGSGISIGFTDLRQNADGGFTIAGWLRVGGAPDSLLMALRTSAPAAGAPPAIVWEEDFGNPFGPSDLANTTVEQAGDGFVFATSEAKGTLIERTDANGLPIGFRSLSFNGFFASSIHLTHSGGLLLGGTAQANGSLGPAIITTDGNGVFLKGMIYQSSSFGEGGEAVATTDGGALLVAGVSSASSGLLVVKTDAALSSGCLESPFTLTPQHGAEGDSIVLTSAGSPTAAPFNVSLIPFYTDSAFCAEAPCAAPPSGMTLWLPLDELTGPTALNVAGGNNGTYHGGPTPRSDGYVDNSLCFDGAQSYVEVPSYPAIDVTTGDFSIDAWIRRAAGDNITSVIVDKRQEVDLGPPAFGYSFFLRNGNLAFQLADGGFDNYDSTAVVPSDGAWHHVAVTVSRHDPAGGRFYIDGAPAGVPFSPLHHTGSLSTGNPLRVGSRSTTVSALFRGCIDEVETFNRALTAEEVAALYAARSNGKCKQSCFVPWASPFCSRTSSLLASAKICSSLATAQTFQYSFQDLPVSADCPAAGPTSFTPATGSIVLQPGQCASVPVRIARPSGLAPSQPACYDMFVETAGGTRAAACRGSVQLSRNFCWTWDPNLDLPFVVGQDASITFRVDNTGAGGRSIGYQVSAVTDALAPTTAISLNGQPPGTPVTGTIDLPAGGSASLEMLAGFREYQPGRFLTLLAQADLQGNGTLVPLSSTLVQNVIPATCNPPSIVQPPGSRTVAAGQPLTLSVVAADASPASYQWRRNGVDLTDGGTLSGTSASTLTIAPAAFKDAGLYDVVVTTGCGAATSPPATVSVAGATCTPGPATLCLNGGRFAVAAEWRTPEGAHGTGQAVQLTDETGSFSFFAPANIELAVKVLNACSFNGRFWVFAAGLTDVEVTLKVTDTRTGAVKSYHNPLGQAFQPIQDTSSLASCLPADKEHSLPLSKPVERQASAGAGSPATALVLGGRFLLEASWQTTPGTSGDGQAVPLSGLSGAFWFFDSSNLELLAKVLDGCGLNGHFWVFAGGLTNVQVALKITDTFTGAVKTYTNPGGVAFRPIQDTSAFATCP